MGGRSHDVSILNRILEQTGSDQTGRVSHVDQQDGAYFVRDLAHTLVVPLTRISRSTADDQLGFVLQSLALHIVVIHALGLRIELVTDGFEIGTRHIHRRTVRKVAAVRQIEAHERIAGFQHGEENGHVGLCAGVGLYVGVLGAVQFANTFDGKVLDLIHHLTTAVVTCGRITLRILVGQYGAHGLHHLVADKIFRRDQLDAVHLTVPFLRNEVEYLRISLHDRYMVY